MLAFINRYISQIPFTYHSHHPTPTSPRTPPHRGQEICSGAQRCHDADQLADQMSAKGIDAGPLKFYLEAFRHGMPPHAGAGIGLEVGARALLPLPSPSLSSPALCYSLILALSMTLFLTPLSNLCTLPSSFSPLLFSLFLPFSPLLCLQLQPSAPRSGSCFCTSAWTTSGKPRCSRGTPGGARPRAVAKTPHLHLGTVETSL